jgi:hypothetical protein
MMDEYSPTDAKLLISPNGHEVVVGRTGSGKTTKLVESLQRDWDANRKIWVISTLKSELSRSHLADWIATTVDDAVQMLRELSDLVEHPHQTYDLTIVIDDATVLLKEIDVLTEVEFLAEKSPSWLKLRLAVGSTLHWGVAGSTTLYNTLIEDAKEMV